jgi:adenylosuccinate lyase
MAADLSERVCEIAEERGVSESEVFEEALERGVDALWEEVVLSRYVRDELDRETAVELVGEDAVRRAEREVEVVEEDVRWEKSSITG